ncbi:MAG: 4-hydroxy-tetrahydrodipicolinate reductase [Candidatus Cloacimonetes bacterium]|nr:4-hydroxy-tetrahydrodipicolinate reductase [Candidatus Cloacimonadota bacterium]
MLRIALIGFGKMGQTLSLLAPHFGMEIVAKIDPFVDGCAREISEENLNNCDVCIEYTTPQTVIENCRKIAALGKQIVIGTTGLDSHLSELKGIAEKYKIGIVYSANYSIGMNVFFKLLEHAAKLFSPLEGYDVSGLEIHHRQKLDSPSGTAKKITQLLIDNLQTKTKEQYDKVDGRIAKDELHFASIRSGANMGEHTVYFDSDADVITLSHSIRNRNGLAEGTLRAAEWIGTKKGLFNFQELFEEIIGDKK